MSRSTQNKPKVTRQTSILTTRARPAPTFANAITDDYKDPSEVERVCNSVLSSLGTGTVDLCILFASGPGHPDLPKVASTVQERLSPNVMIGCSGSGIIGEQQEIEYGQGLSVIAANCDTSKIKPFAFEDKHANAKDDAPETLIDAMGIHPDDVHGGTMLILVDPLTVATESALSTLDSAYPHTIKFGGLVGGGLDYGDNAMFIGDRILRQGAVGLMLGSMFQPEILVSSNEIPIGDPIPIAVSNRNVILRFDERGPDGITPLELLRNIQEVASERTRVLLQQTLVAGIECDRTSYPNTGHYDFVMRNIMGLDDDTGAMAIGDLVEEGQLFQFHVRDPAIAASNLQELLETRLRESHDAPPPDLVLCFNSITRGKRLHTSPHHDIGMISKYIDGAPAAGFFSNGEIVSGIGGFLEDEYVTKVMGYTHSITMLTSKHDDEA